MGLAKATTLTQLQELRYGSETKRLRTRPGQHHHEVYESAAPSSEHGQAPSEWHIAGLVSHGFKIEKETSTKKDDVARTEAAAKLKSKFNALGAAKEAERCVKYHVDPVFYCYGTHCC